MNTIRKEPKIILGIIIDDADKKCTRTRTIFLKNNNSKSKTFSPKTFQ